MSLERLIVLYVFLISFSPPGWSQWMYDSWSSVNILSRMLDLDGEWDGEDIREVIESTYDKSTVDSLLAEHKYLSINDYAKTQLILTAGRVLEQKEGYIGDHPLYYGGAWNSRVRTSVKGRSYSFYALAESDAGESKLPFADHRTAGLEIEPIREKVKLVFGDFTFDHGLGVLFSTRTAFSGWNVEPQLLVYRSRGLRANSSGNEDRFLRGGGIQWERKRLMLTGFFSEKPVDALMQDNVIQCFHGNGYHRSERERELAAQVNEKIQGLFVRYKSDNLQTGGGYVKFEYQDKHYERYGLYTKILFRGGMLFGELSGSSSGGLSVYCGLSYFGSDRHRFLFDVQSGEPNYFQRFTGLGSSNQLYANKNRLRMNYKFILRRQWSLQVDLSVYEAIWLKSKASGTKADSRIRMGLSREDYDIFKFDFRISKDGSLLRGLLRYRRNIGINGCYIIGELAFSKSLTNKSSSSTGYYLSFDAGWNLAEGKLKIRTGTMLHRIDKDSPALYRYEPDLYYQMSIPVISGSGYRYYLCIRAEITKQLSFEAKLNRYSYFDRSSLGSGAEKIDNTHRSLFRMQIVLRL